MISAHWVFALALGALFNFPAQAESSDGTRQSGEPCSANSDCHVGLGCSQSPYGGSTGYCRRRVSAYIAGMPGEPGAPAYATFRIGAKLMQVDPEIGWKDSQEAPWIRAGTIPNGYETHNYTITLDPANWCKEGSFGYVAGGLYCKAKAATCAHPRRDGIMTGQTYRDSQGTYWRCLSNGTYSSFLSPGTLSGGAEMPPNSDCSLCASGNCSFTFEDKPLTYGNKITVCKDVRTNCAVHFQRAGVPPGTPFSAGGFTALCDRDFASPRIVGGGKARVKREVNSSVLPTERYQNKWGALPAELTYDDPDQPGKKLSPLSVIAGSWRGTFFHSPYGRCSARFSIVGYDKNEPYGMERFVDILYETHNGVESSPYRRLAEAPIQGNSARVRQLQNEVIVGRRGWTISGVTPIVAAHQPNQFYIPVTRPYYKNIQYVDPEGRQFFSPLYNTSYDEAIILRAVLNPSANCELRLIDSVTFNTGDAAEPNAIAPAEPREGLLSTRGTSEVDVSLRMAIPTWEINPFARIKDGPLTFQEHVRASNGGVNASLRTSNERSGYNETVAYTAINRGPHYIWYNVEGGTALRDQIAPYIWPASYTRGGRYHKPASPTWSFRPLADGSEWIVLNLTGRRYPQSPSLFRWIDGDWDWPGIMPAVGNRPRTHLYLAMKDPVTQEIVDTTLIEVASVPYNEPDLTTLYNSMVYQDVDGTSQYIYAPGPKRTWEIEIEPVY